MQGYSAEEYQLFVRRCLERLSNRAVDELDAVFQQSKDWSTQVLEIVIIPRGILKGLPITLIFKDQAQQPISGGIFEMENLLGPVLTTAEKDLVYRYDDNGVETLEIELQTLIEWFPICWLAANGPELPQPAFIGIENDLEVLDLKTMKWIPNPNRTKTKKEGSQL